MADQLYLSYWLRGFTEHNMLRHFEVLLRKFPFSRLRPQLALTINAIELAEPALLERDFPDGDIAAVIETAKEHAHADCAYAVDAAWDIWQHDAEWKLRPAPVRLNCFGPLFPSERGEQVLLEFGHDAYFLPQPGLASNLAPFRHNIRGLLHLAEDLDGSLAVSKRLLWSECGENFAGRLEAALAGEV